MAEQDDNWFGAWLTAAKDKSSKVLEFVKKDLEEFGNVVKNEASNVVSTTGTVLEKTLKLDSPDSTASSMKRSFSSFLGQMNTVLNPSPDDSDAEAILVIEDSETIPLTKLQKSIYELQKNAETFVKDPEDDLKPKFDCWLEIIDDQLSEERINKHLQSSSVLRRQYEKLVPELVTHSTFWKRYLFKKALLEDDIARQEVLEKREKLESKAKEENLKWENEDFAPYIELTEEEQTKLLEEYENEIKSTKKVVTKSSDKGKSDDDEDDDKSGSSGNGDKKEEKRPSSGECNNKSNVSTDKMGKVDSAISLDTNSEDSTDGDWEKISDVDK